MAIHNDGVSAILNALIEFRKSAGLTRSQVEESLLLGPGWIERFEDGHSLPSLDLLLGLTKHYGREAEELVQAVNMEKQTKLFARDIFAEQVGSNLRICFTYAKHDAKYLVASATVDQYNQIIKNLRDSLARLADCQTNAEAIKTEAVASTFLLAVQLWPHVNPSDIWYFVVYRAYLDVFNHPAEFARLDLGQSWKRTGGWALEEVLVRHYKAFLANNNVEIKIAVGADEKRRLTSTFHVSDRLEPDKIDVFLSGIKGGKQIPFGVVHVKASFAERRTDDVPMSSALVNAGYCSPLWTMDCKATPSSNPRNRGELGQASGNRSAKRKDIEDDAYFSACFSYNSNTQQTASSSAATAKVVVCDFNNPDDKFSQWVLDFWNGFAKTQS